MERKLYQTICKNLNKSCSVEFSFSVVTKGIEVYPNLKNINDKDIETINEGLESWIYDELEKLGNEHDAYFDAGTIKFDSKEELLYKASCEVDDNSIIGGEVDSYNKNKLVTVNLKKIACNILNINMNKLNEESFNLHIDIDKNKGIEGFNNFKIYYDFDNGKEIELELDEKKSLKIKEEILDIISEWSGQYWGDLGEVETNIKCEMEDSFTITDMISFSKKIEISGE